jgi:hypothetical protein
VGLREKTHHSTFRPGVMAAYFSSRDSSLGYTVADVAVWRKRSGPGEIVEILGLRLSKFFKFIGWLRIELKTVIFVMPYDQFKLRHIQFHICVVRIFEKKISNEVY